MSKRTLLLADDSVTIQKVVNLTFADEGIEVITVGDGDSAMEKISQMSPDVVLADVHMPGLSGYRICEILRQNPVTQNTPVVLLVGSFEPFDEGEAARVGANAYLTKPFQSIRQLVSQVTDLMEAANPKPEPVAEEQPAVEEETFEQKPAAVSAADDDREDEEWLRETPPTSDIESLYHQSFSDPSAGDSETETGAAPRYVDAGMDDEMIETSFADSSDQLSEEPSPAIAADGEAGFRALDREVAEASNDELNYSPSEPERDSAKTDPLETMSDFKTVPDGGDEVSEAANYANDPLPEFDEFSRTAPLGEIGASPDEFGLDEMELLELPPIENGKTLEFTTTQGAIAEEGSKQVVSLSPELMDLIVQKVVEKLSEKY